jgi:hypothetical protein
MRTNPEPNETKFARHRRGVVARLDTIQAELAEVRAALDEIRSANLIIRKSPQSTIHNEAS